jgi:hypothetical protein
VRRPANGRDQLMRTGDVVTLRRCLPDLGILKAIISTASSIWIGYVSVAEGQQDDSLLTL